MTETPEPDNVPSRRWPIGVLSYLPAVLFLIIVGALLVLPPEGKGLRLAIVYGGQLLFWPAFAGMLWYYAGAIVRHPEMDWRNKLKLLIIGVVIMVLSGPFVLIFLWHSQVRQAA